MMRFAPRVRRVFARAVRDRGSVAAEFAVTLPALVLVVGLGVAALAAGAQSVRLQDAAADAARLVARGESEERVRAIATAAGAASILVGQEGELVCVRLSGGLELGVLATAGITLSARSCALADGW